ncbi:peptidoglycan-recognition protein SB2-like isoform X1 [Macrosteles quadrilineatus]|uniref:peptidoglycan-recognition protein SB2-like isoform X1 n=1 Tax=Macrosteles quadrilineatus TaxID=74068 RepID=UPI0023E1C2B8|nr:peptidoglycan-recognition protein SB2-like isoform X1 [Macrosteles quadrilineatus]XP_054263426.1 peptidoglycan-recognition protein SB2-like isoform X1 [Macrosteles quadrilineatus]XP_054263428.1 peptidoglycan-recognition protein SB2-like isoform X1 [Macrosteles quadrilineatus]XP_054263429.1 peptidoglycan-recognition protein SB2-like isoform X1 [Macrosteles quadrilineatus]
MVLHFTEECIVKRSEWGAKDATGPLDVLQHPVKEVLLTYTGTNICTTAEECRQFARELQEEYQKHNLKDIGPNFMIGGDGFVYEGRGWNFAPEQHPCAPQLHGKALEIAHFGCKGDYPPKENVFLSWDLITLGVKKRKIEQVPDYTACYDWESLDPVIYHKKTKSESEAPQVTTESRQRITQSENEKSLDSQSEAESQVETASATDDSCVEQTD